MMALMGAGTGGILAGCTGGGGGDGGDGGDGGGGGGGSELEQAVSDLDFSENWQERRGISNRDDWAMEDRLQVPEGDALYEIDEWLDTTSVDTAHWEPPSGWEDTAAGDVDTLQHLNYGDLQFDRATVATYALFEKVTGIEIETLEIVVDQAIPKMAANFSAQESSPHFLCNSAHQSMSSYAAGGHLEPVGFTQPNDEMWDPYIPTAKETFHFQDTLWGGPNIVEGTAVHIRPDLFREQGVSEDVVSRAVDGEWDWDDLETIMEAFAGTGQFGFAYRGASRVYSEQDFKVLWYSTGDGYVNDDGTVTVNTDPAVATLQKMVDWRDKGWVPEAVTNWTQGDLADGFLSENLVAVPVATDLIADAIEQGFEKGSDYTITTIPSATTGPEPQPSTLATTTLNSINKYAPTPEKVAASLYLDCRYSYASSWWEYVEEGNMAYETHVYEDAGEQAHFSTEKGEAMQHAKLEVFGQQRAISQKVSEEVQIAYSGDKEPQQALDDAQSFIDTVLSQ